jgi:tRNA pseudouridine38-40 synthase
MVWGTPPGKPQYTHPLKNLNEDGCMQMIRAHVCYTGTHYCGWQRQSDQIEKRKASVQGKLEIAVRQWCGEHVDVIAVSRTDAGTHALMNYCHMLLPISKLAETSLRELTEHLNALLHHTIRVRLLEPVAGLHKSRKADQKRYYYYIQQGPRRLMDHAKECWYIPKILNVARLEEALSYLEGKHDLKYFTSGKAAAIPANSFRTISSARLTLLDSVDFSLSGHTRTAMAECMQEELRSSPIGGVMPDGKTSCYFLCFSFTANGFLTHNVRRIMGTMRQVGELACSNGPLHIKDVLAGQAPSGPSSPAHGLWLDHIWMPAEPPAEGSAGAADSGERQDTVQSIGDSDGPSEAGGGAGQQGHLEEQQGQLESLEGSQRSPAVAEPDAKRRCLAEG